MTGFVYDDEYIASRCDPSTEVGAAHVNAMAEAKRRAKLKQDQVSSGGSDHAPVTQGEPAEYATEQPAPEITGSSVEDAKDETPMADDLTLAGAEISDNDQSVTVPTAPASGGETASGETETSSTGDGSQALAVSAEPTTCDLVGPKAEGEIAITRRQRGRPFPKGHSGNLKGRPRGSPNKMTKMVRALLEAGAESVAKKAVEMAAAGDAKMIALLFSRMIAPAKEVTVAVDIPELNSPTACRIAKAKLAQAMAAGEISSAEAARQIAIVDAVERSLHGLDVECRYDERMADLHMSGLMAKYPHSRHVDLAVARYFAFDDELRALKLSQRQYERLWLQYWDHLSSEARDAINAIEDAK